MLIANENTEISLNENQCAIVFTTNAVEGVFDTDVYLNIKDDDEEDEPDLIKLYTSAMAYFAENHEFVVMITKAFLKNALNDTSAINDSINLCSTSNCCNNKQ